MSRCLFCYAPLSEHGQEFHTACSNRIFGTPMPPELPYTESDLEPLARQVVQSRFAVTGVQAKISLDLSAKVGGDNPRRFTIVGLWGAYILKPPAPRYPQLPEVEDLTMHLAEAVGIKTVPHTLIRIRSGSLAYVTRRVDRASKGKLAMEDMCQLTERLTEDKYDGSYEQIGKTISRHSTTPGLDLVDYFETVLFCFLTGNADMHLKNFALLEHPGLGMRLSPAYDLVNTALVNPDDDEETALTLNGRKRRIQRRDFIAAMQHLQLTASQQDNIFTKMANAVPDWMDRIDAGFLSDDYKQSYKTILTERSERVL